MTTPAPATDRQMAYLRKLVEAQGSDIRTFLINQGITKTEGWPVPEIVAAVPTKAQASRLIDSLAPASTGYARRSRGGRRYTPMYRCTHEDYPCCGCER